MIVYIKITVELTPEKNLVRRKCKKSINQSAIQPVSQ